MNVHRSGLFACILGLVTALLVGCACEVRNVVLDDFEICGDGCGWTAANGEPLQTVRTFHSAETGLLIPPGVVAQRPEGLSGEELHLVSNCARGLELWVAGEGGRQVFRLDATTSDRGNGWYRLAVVLASDGKRFNEVALVNDSVEDCIVDQLRILETGSCL